MEEAGVPFPLHGLTAAATRRRQWQRDHGNGAATAEAAVSMAVAGSAAAVLARWKQLR